MPNAHVPAAATGLPRYLRLIDPPDAIDAAITAHRVAYEAFQVAPEGEASLAAEDAYGSASDALVATACATRFGALTLLAHLRWWIAEEAEFKDAHQPAYGIAQARACDLALFLDIRCAAPRSVTLAEIGR